MTRGDDALTAAIVLGFSLVAYAVVDVGVIGAAGLGMISYGVVLSAAHKLHDAVSRDPDADDFDGPVGARDARQAYVSGEIDEDELERRLDLAYDPDVRAIRREYESIDGVGETTCHKLAAHFGTLEAIDQATTDELEQVDGIGEKKADDIHDHDVSPDYTEPCLAQH